MDENVSTLVDVARTEIMTSPLPVTERDRLLSFIAGKAETITQREPVSHLTSAQFLLLLANVKLNRR